MLVLSCLQCRVQENYTNYDKGVLAEILEPIMGKGLIPAGGCRMHPSGGQPCLSLARYAVLWMLRAPRWSPTATHHRPAALQHGALCCRAAADMETWKVRRRAIVPGERWGCSHGGSLCVGGAASSLRRWESSRHVHAFHHVHSVCTHCVYLSTNQASTRPTLRPASPCLGGARSRPSRSWMRSRQGQRPVSAAVALSLSLHRPVMLARMLLVMHRL